jgi:hypothetical protein
MNIMLVLRDTALVTRVMAHTAAVTRVTGHTGPVMPVPLAMSPPLAPSRSRLAIGRITRMAPGITSGGPITSGGRDIGQTAADKESGSAGITSAGDKLRRKTVLNNQ